MRAAKEVFDNLSAVDTRIVDELLAKEWQRFDKKIVVLDDDPTGVQTVHGISVFTDWSEKSIEQGFLEKNRLFFILTNSRSLIASETEAVHQEIGRTVSQVAARLNQPFVVISRADSTLRGHYPLETETLKAAIEAQTDIVFDGEVLIPFFQEGGRYTIDNTHYVQYGAELVPAGETEFAKDRTFGYTKSHLGEWVEEKSNGAYKAADTTYITLERIRTLEIDKITDQLLAVQGFQKIVINAVDYVDVKIVTIALLRAMMAGKNFMFRSAAALPKIIGGISDKPYLTREELVTEETGHGGLIIVGSHVKKTTEQLEELKMCPSIRFIEFDCHLVLEPDRFQSEIDRVIALAEELLASGQTVTVYTRRERLDLGEHRQDEELLLSVKISDAVTSIVERLTVRPSYLIAKGGITSSDVGTKGLRVRRATVAGQIKPGVPVWMTGEESRFPGMAYVIFPGNVGTKTTLRETVEILTGRVLSP
ncbi:hydroxyacid dehydrogenase [Brevibacillus ruminantium]|uniref:Hydroxyacid dehydrogenase n=1 Tax=Brevibacillus ruminantium TaxID=2950604 RepID=A0ABY4WKM8_9BACL|nr:four-carbon acid sugar kinase family protein [Brevibacillus ruminantium]USG66617.1 hydroxyacid dehydrogenase [Brevibacillus ruminantium]